MIIAKTLIDVYIKKLFSKKEQEQENSSPKGLDEKLMRYKEFKYLYNKTYIKPVYYFYLLLVCLFFISVGYLQNLLSCLIGITYPMYFSIKALREKNKERIKSWLQYWIIFSIFLNLEDVFCYILGEIQLYFFYKVLFLLICYLPQYNGAKYFYENLVKEMFIKYEIDVCNISRNIVGKLKNTLLDEDEGKSLEHTN
jgi:hypothetical protein